MLKSVSLIILFQVVCWASLSAQFARPSTYVRVTNANDMYYKPLKTDKYFTNGVDIEVGRQRLRVPGWRVTGRIRETSFLRLTQNIYTPVAIEETKLLTNDRPFASTLHLAHGKELLDEAIGFRFRRVFTAGILGRPAQGEWAQNWFHGLVPWAEEVPGWRHQVKTDVILNYQLGMSKLFRSNRRTALELGFDGRLGTLNTDLSFFSRALWRIIGDYDKQVALTLELQGSARAVGYDATLSGGLLNRDDRYRSVIKPERLVLQGGFAAQLAVGRLQLGTGVTYLRPEFKGGWSHVWAYWSAGYWITGSRRNTHP